MQRIPFNLLDSSFLNVELTDEPLNIHVELQFEGRIDRDRLRSAIATACARHPMARAKVEPFHAGAVTNYWQITDEPEREVLFAHAVSSDDELAVVRDRIVSAQPDYLQSPALEVHLIVGPESDSLITVLNHIIADGLSAFRFLNSVMRAYGDEDDPVPDFDPLSKRDLKQLVGSKNLAEAAKRLGALVKTLVQSVEPPARVRGQGALGQEAGYGVELLALSKEETAQFMSRRVKPATVNDMLMAAMLLTIRRWNADSGSGGGSRVSTMMPINIRPSEWWFEVVGNYSSYVTINLFRHCPDDFEGAVRMVQKQSSELKDAGASGTLIDLLDIPKWLPAGLKGQLRYITPTLAANMVDTTWVSNLGRLAEPPSMGDAGRVKAFYFSPPSPKPMGLALGVACVADRLYLSFRYRRSLLSPDATRAFVSQFKALLLTV